MNATGSNERKKSTLGRVNACRLWYPDDRTKLFKVRIKRKGVRDA